MGNNPGGASDSSDAVGASGKSPDDRKSISSFLPEIEKAAMAFMGPKTSASVTTPSPAKSKPDKKVPSNQSKVFEKIPLMVLCRIFASLSARDLAMCALVNHEFAEVIEISNIWETKAVEEIQETESLFTQMLHESASLSTSWKKLYKKYKFKQSLLVEKQFARVVYDYKARGDHELDLSKDEIVRVLISEDDNSVWCLIEKLNRSLSPTTDLNDAAAEEKIGQEESDSPTTTAKGWVPSGYLEDIPRKYLQRKVGDRNSTEQKPLPKEGPKAVTEEPQKPNESKKDKEKKKEMEKALTTDEGKKTKKKKDKNVKESEKQPKKKEKKKKKKDTKKGKDGKKENETSLKPLQQMQQAAAGTTPPTPTSMPTPTRTPTRQRMVRAVYDYTASDDNEVSFKKYDLMNLLEVLDIDGRVGEFKRIDIPFEEQQQPQHEGGGEEGKEKGRGGNGSSFKMLWLKVSLTRRTDGGGTVTAYGRIPGSFVTEDVDYVTVLFDYEACSEFELSLKKGQRVAVLERDAEKGWLYAQSLGQRGWIPENNVTEAS